MEYRELILSAIQSLKINKLRTSLTMLGIIIGISAVILISSIGQSSVKFVTDEFNSFGTNYFQVTPGKGFRGAVGGSTNPLTMEDVDAIAASDISNISSIAPFNASSGEVRADNQSVIASIYGVTPEAYPLLNPEIIYGEFITDVDRRNRVVILGIDVSNELFGEDTNPVGENVRISNNRYRVIGVSKSGGSLTGGFFNSSVTIPLEVLNAEITGSDNLREIDIMVLDTNLIEETMDDVEALLRDYRGIKDGDDSDFTLVSFEETLNTIETITSLLTTMIAGISAISLLVGGVGVMNIMLVSVTERTKEIGLLKSIGAKENDILTQFLIESVVMTVSGGLIGIVIGASLSFLVSQIANIPFVISIFWIILAVAVSTLVGVIFGLYPARRAAKLSPIDALRHE